MKHYSSVYPERCGTWSLFFSFFFFKLSSFVLTIPKFVWPSFRRVSYDSEGLIEVSWSVVRFGVWCEEARTTPNLSNWCYRRLPYVIGGHAIRSLMWIWFTKYCCYSIIIIIVNVVSLILTKIWRKQNVNEWSSWISEGSSAPKILEKTKLYVKNLEIKSR